MMSNALQVTVGTIDAFCGFVMVWSFVRITTAAGLRTVQARWALFRRFVYACSSIALFGLGVGRWNGEYPLVPSEAVLQMMLLFGVVIFPLLRAFGWITQDTFKPIDDSRY
jgi:hypothetical protein